jgi:O-acetyl-ADP-ribose deacetylase (regulator of RNase III)
MNSETPHPEKADRSYRIGGRRLGVVFGRLEDSLSEALVSSDDNYLTMGGGVSASLHRAGGPRVSADARKHLPLRLGDVVVTSAGDLPAKYVLHGVTIDRDDLEKADSACIKKITTSSLKIAEALRLKSISFPALGTGLAGLAYERSSEALTLAIVEFLSHESGSVESVDLVIHPSGRRIPHPVDSFYARAAQLATQWTDVRKLKELITVARKVAPMYDLDRTNRALEMLHEEISQAPNLFDYSNDEEGETDRVSSMLQPIAQSMSNAMEVSLTSPSMPDESSAVLRLRLQSLRTQVNILIGNLNQLEERRARYGPLSTPLEIENSIMIINQEIEEKENEIRKVVGRLS